MSTKNDNQTKHGDAALRARTGTHGARSRSSALRVAALAVLVVGGFALSHALAGARIASPLASASASAGAVPAASSAVGGGSQGSSQVAAGSSATSGSPGADAGYGCACCGGAAAGGTSASARGAAATGGTGAATTQAGIQRITIDTSGGVYRPSTIKLKAGVPAQITFRRASGCLGQVVSQALGFSEDLTTGDKTVKLAAPRKGTYAFSCGMRMVFGTVTVQ